MSRSLKFLSISHHQATTTERALFHLSEQEKIDLQEIIPIIFPDVIGLMLLSTCNRMEIYFESTIAHAENLIESLLKFKELNTGDFNKNIFQIGNDTEETLQHLLLVSSGLDSAIKGDFQIISQIKQAYKIAIKNNLQGRFLERAMQTTFRLGKRITNETAFRDGSLSTAYQSLKSIEAHFSKPQLPYKKLLIIGLGDIGKAVIEYLGKFPFQEVYVCNRTISKAEEIAKKHEFKVLPWEEVEKNNVAMFDAIITGVSERADLLHKPVSQPDSNPVWVDLAMPGNIASHLTEKNNQKIINLDHLKSEASKTAAERKKAISEVKKLIELEKGNFLDWFERYQLRHTGDACTI
ncbi:MAG: hypothetical protein KTR26_03925 [Flammeovirgaceae bacterium]|nr:hypothetical protein [Flammeovirgaceae bacterium]